MSEGKWYVVHTYSGYEDKVKANIEKAIENRNMEHLIFEVRVPKEEVIELKESGRKPSMKKLFPGYVFVNMVMTDDTWYVVRNTRGVTGFVGPGSKPVPLTEKDLLTMEAPEERKVVMNMDIGDSVIVVSGPWKDTLGTISSINKQKETVTIMVDFFGRETPVELSFAAVKKTE